VLIAVVCPFCDTRYQVQQTLRGQPMRCPNPPCRKVFTVPAAEASAPPPGKGRRSGSVGDLVPLVEAKAAEPAAAPKSAPDWRNAPPVRRPMASAPAAAPASPAAKEGPREMPPGAWEPPPVRRGAAAVAKPPAAEAPVEAAPEPPMAEPIADEPIERHGPRKRTGLFVVVFVVGVVVVLGVAVGVVWMVMGGSESYYAAEAEKSYKTEHFSQAASQYQQLAANFPASDKHDLYQLMQGLSELRNQAAAPDPDAPTVLEQYDRFITEQSEKDPPALKERAPDLAETVGRLADAYARHNASPKDDAPLAVAEQINKALARATALDPAVPSPELRGRIDKDLGGVKQAVTHVLSLNAAVARIMRATDAGSTAERLGKWFKWVRKEQITNPDIVEQPAVKDLRTRLDAQLLKDVQYKEAGNELPAAPKETSDTSYIIDPSLRGAPGKAPPNDPVVLSVARGVLYALSRANGQTRWAVRVGVDAPAPVRVPEAEGMPERILVLSGDGKNVDAIDPAVDPDRHRLWRYTMNAACVGRPLIVGNVAYLAAYDGNVHEIELAQGRLLGVYPLGQPLTVGGAQDPATGLLYFPADEFCVYVINPEKHQCVGALYTGHSAGSQRGAPLVVTSDPQVEDSSWLVLNQTSGLHAMQLRVYHLPFDDRDRERPPDKLVPEPPMPGWTWFPPYHDGEKLAMLGDAGVLGLFGIRQPRNPQDAPLFPLLPNNLDLETSPTAAIAHAKLSSKEAGAYGRSEVVEVQGQDFWLLAGGELKRFSLGLSAAKGPQLTPAAGWDPLMLGSPLHQSQVEADPARPGTTLVLTTQPLKRQTCLATAVDDRSGEILWQRQLGLVCQGEPLELRPPGPNGTPVLIALDQSGALFAFDDPALHAALADGELRRSGQLLFDAMDDGPGAPPVLLPAPDGRSAFEIASPGDGTRLVVRRVEATANGLVKKEWSVALEAPLAGTPAVTDAMIVLPLGDGLLGRLALPLDEKSVIAEGPEWRSRRDPPNVRGRVLALGPEEFLASDGARALTHWQWHAPKDFESLPAGKKRPTLQRKEAGSLTADPVLLPEVPNSPRQVCIAEVGGVVTILTVLNDGGLKAGRSWDLHGPISAGPYVQLLPDGATRIACVVNETQLVWLDPAKDGELWRHPAKPGANLVGLPRLVGDRVVVADELDRIVGLDPATGEAGPEYQIEGSTAPTASPVGLGGERLFVPLTDGTVLLPKVKSIRPKG
jgi:hypothetical protein